MPTKIVKSILLETLVPIITQMVNLSFKEGIFPESYKEALLQPLIKKILLDFDIFKNYRPVSNLVFVSKVMEKAVAVRIFAHLRFNNLLEIFQSAYKELHSTETALLRVQNDVLRAIDNRESVFLVMIDLSAAFDTIDHSVMLSLLKNSFGIEGTALNWFKTYLTNRRQRVSINGVK